MSKPNNSIAKIKVPGENEQRPIIPYAVGVNGENPYQAVLPELDEDETIAVSKDLPKVQRYI